MIIYTIKSIRRFFSLYKHVQSKGLDLFRIYSFLSLIIIEQQWANMISTKPYLLTGVSLFLVITYMFLSFVSFWQQMIKLKKKWSAIRVQGWYDIEIYTKTNVTLWFLCKNYDPYVFTEFVNVQPSVNAYNNYLFNLSIPYSESRAVPHKTHLYDTIGF